MTDTALHRADSSSAAAVRKLCGNKGNKVYQQRIDPLVDVRRTHVLQATMPVGMWKHISVSKRGFTLLPGTLKQIFITTSPSACVVSLAIQFPTHRAARACMVDQL